MQKRYTVEKSYGIALHFFFSLWPLVKEKVESQPEDVCQLLEIFLFDVCLGTEVSAEWNEAIFRHTGIPKANQRELTLTSDEMFLCGVEFCHLFHERFSCKLGVLVDLVSLMQTNPSHCKAEWSIWEETIQKSDHETLTLLDFDWTVELP